MARSFCARMGTIILAASTLAACDRTPTDNGPDATFHNPGASFARGGNGKGSSSTSDQQQMAISPAALSLTVGQQAVVAVTYWDRHGDVIPETVAKMTYYGCLKVNYWDPDCSSIVSIAPGGTNYREATVTGIAPGTVQVYAADGFGTWVMSVVTVQ